MEQINYEYLKKIITGLDYNLISDMFNGNFTYEDDMYIILFFIDAGILDNIICIERKIDKNVFYIENILDEKTICLLEDEMYELSINHPQI
jgi:hypothetical protein